MDNQNSVPLDQLLSETAFGQMAIKEQQDLPIIETILTEPDLYSTHCYYCNNYTVMPKSGLCLACGKVTVFDNQNSELSGATVAGQTAIEEQQDMRVIETTEADSTPPVEYDNETEVSLLVNAENTLDAIATQQTLAIANDFVAVTDDSQTATLLPENAGNIADSIKDQPTLEIINGPVAVEYNSGTDSTEEHKKTLNIEQTVTESKGKTNIDKALDATANQSTTGDSGLVKPSTPENPFLLHKGDSTKSDVIEFCKGVFDQLKERLFSNKSHYKPLNILPACSLVEEHISMDVVQNLFPIRNYDNEKLLAFTSDLKSEICPKQTTLFHIGDKTDSALYLLKGVISLSDENGKNSELVSGTEEAKFPLSSSAIHTKTAITKTDVSVLRVSQKIMSRKHAPLSPFSTLVIPNEITKNHLMSSFLHHYNNEELNILSLPDVTVKLRNAMQNDASITKIVKIIQLDPVISAKLIGLANSPLYVSASPVKSCIEAVNRIGLNATRSFVISLSLSRVFKNNSPLVIKYADKIWKQSIYISKLSYILATVTKQVNPEKALLAGLVCDIGAIPFLSFAANLPKDYCSESDIELILPYVKGPIGYKVLNDWGFSEEFLKIPLDSENWYQNSSDELNLTDIVVLSRFHSRIGKPNTPKLPTLTSIPATNKFKKNPLSPDLSLYVLYKAKQQVNDIMKAFTS
ncbi:MAG: HDOD domain-containing protein [Methylobacter sp.]|nr:HDOD domain-containing protein [Candidatus Methylobacter titanis]